MSQSVVKPNCAALFSKNSSQKGIKYCGHGNGQKRLQIGAFCGIMQKNNVIIIIGRLYMPISDLLELPLFDNLVKAELVERIVSMGEFLH